MSKQNTKNRKQRPRVYSYVRFSTPEQSMGHSERRQFEAASEWVKRKGLRLDDQLTDRGLSGYHGHHRTKGALGDFLRHVEEGKVPPGSILLVENIDRLSREGAVKTLRDIIFKIWEHDITLQTLGPEETFAPDCADDPNSSKFIMLMFSIQRAQAESKRKSDLIRASRLRSFEAARKDGVKVTAKCPEWLVKVSDYRFDVIPEAADTIRLIFDWKLQGLSQRKIESRLNAEAAWKPPPRKLEDRKAHRSGNGWRTSYIKKVLGNRAVIGEYQPHRRVDGKREPFGPPIEGYYPPIIEPEVFYAVQQLLEANRGKGGRTGKKRNIFTHIVTCGYCGGPMRFTDKGKDWQYLVCDNAARGVSCKCHAVRYAEAQGLVLESCHHLKPEQVLPSSDEQTATVKALRQRVKAGEAELRDIEEQIENFMEQIGRTRQPKIRDRYEVHIEKLYERTESVATTLEKNQRDLTNAESGTKRFKSWKRGLAELMTAITDEDAAEIRVRLSIYLREFIDRTEIFPVGFKVVADRKKHFVTERGESVPGRNGRKRRRPAKRGWLPNVDTIVETLGDFWSEIEPRPTKKQRAAFERYVLDRRMSKEGRFYRIHFKTGERIDVVPPDGIATGFMAIKGAIERVLPDFERLWKEFSKAKGEG